MDVLNAIVSAAKQVHDWVDENKVQKISGKGLSTNDYTTAEKQAVSAIATDLTLLDGKLYLSKDGELLSSGVTLPSGTDGKSAYQYAQEGGYTGTEAEFAEKLAKEMPDKLPNPNALTFTGAVTGSYDGSAAVTVEIPSGGGGSQWKIIRDLTITENLDRVDISTDDDGNAFSLHEIHVFSYTQSYEDAEGIYTFLMNGYWTAFDPYISSGLKNTASSNNYKQANHFIATMQNGFADVFQPWVPYIASGKSLGNVNSIGKKYQAIESVSFVGKFIAGCRFVLVGRVSS